MGSLQRGVSSVEVAGFILKQLRTVNNAVTLQELSELTGLAPSKLHHYLVSLVRTGLVRKELDSKSYSLGSFALELGLSVADNLSTQHASAQWLHRLSEATAESSFFAVQSPRGPLIVRWEQGSRPLTVHARLGTVMPLLTSATGLVSLAFDYAKSSPILDTELRKVDPTQRSNLRANRLSEAERVLTEGIACAHGSMIGNVNALACPVFTRKRNFAGILTVLGLDGYFKADPASKAANLLRKISEDFGERLD